MKQPQISIMRECSIYPAWCHLAARPVKGIRLRQVKLVLATALAALTGINSTNQQREQQGRSQENNEQPGGHRSGLLRYARNDEGNATCWIASLRS